jgi:hypothetical protein
MPRIANQPRLTLSDLERMIEKRRAEVALLANEREQLRNRLAALDAKLRVLAGRASTGAVLSRGGRGRTGLSLVATLSNILSGAKKPLSVGEIVEKVQASGYYSKAANFRGLVNQTLIKQRKLFSNAGRGLYEYRRKS